MIIQKFVRLGFKLLEAFCWFYVKCCVEIRFGDASTVGVLHFCHKDKRSPRKNRNTLSHINEGVVRFQHTSISIIDRGLTHSNPFVDLCRENTLIAIDMIINLHITQVSKKIVYYNKHQYSDCGKTQKLRMYA